MGIPSEIFKAYDVRGLYGEQIDGDAAERIGRAFARVTGDLAGKTPADCRIGLGRDMRLTAPELSARYRDGMMSEGATVLDAGQVGTEMLYWLVGSRALSGDSGSGELRELVLGDMGESDPPTRGSCEEVEIYDAFHEAALRVIDPSNVKPMKVVVDGGNGMAGPMVGPLLDQLPLDLVKLYWEPNGEFPDHEP